MMSVSPSEGLVCKTLQKSQVIEEVYFIRAEDIENLKMCTIFKVNTIQNNTVPIIIIHLSVKP